MTDDTQKRGLSRRQLIQSSALVGGSAALNLFAPNIVRAAETTIKIGYITSLSGPRATFSEPAQYTVDTMKALLRDGLEIGGTKYPVEILMRDQQSSPTRAGEVGRDLILQDQVDILLADDGDSHFAAGEIADQKGVPFVSTINQWEPFIEARNSTPEKGYPWSFMFTFGATDIAKTYVGLWETLPTNKKVGVLFLDIPPGHAFGDQQRGIPFFLKQKGFDVVDGGFVRFDSDDFSSQIAMFKEAKCDIIAGFLLDPHFQTFWGQSLQAGLSPKAVTFAGPFLFPTSLAALGDMGDGMSGEVWWTPDVPFKSSLTGQTAREVATAWETATGAQWTQPLGYMHALYEVGLAALKHAKDPRDKEGIREGIRQMALDTVVGPVNFRDSKIKSVAVTEVAMGQWSKTPEGSKFPYELGIVYADPQIAPNLKPNAKMRLLGQS
ncbi:amino acid/amide ABC transporter substrate-binding protein, HAAT family [Kaistia soli DSM 19436]|uniref:Amino acid/amide ABC transporter substrate-binding protein, HAAT family n=1 Tax=Kaistia soli DSM 19436 TaxID=1122133 RepID=A0A1M5KJ94_9HYPH|nr:ABC transporter substrate-binding protein [Kaistia soli]SHG52549.1 amino acid/amide ABC transporter substrate-binding protein, HAAT family [Kaistia soli DSM 19436]